MEEDAPALVEVGRYERLSLARERGLVLSAMGVPHWIVRERPDFILRVELLHQAKAVLELEKYELEAKQRPMLVEPVWEKLSTVSLYVAAWIMGTFWFLQNYRAESWMECGRAVSGRIIHQGEWWRVFTALTLHGDFSHFIANLMVGLLFAAFLIRLWGSGLGWLAIVVSGGAGNWLNAWFYQGKPHISIGASTAVFGALGLLVGGEFFTRLFSPHSRGRWQLILPLGAGLALLAFLGAGDEQKHTDFMAHFWGFSVGLFIGAAVTALNLKERAPRSVQRVAALAAPLLIALAWWRALAG
jgi:membrane associated rhomboid family serine protease